jgi:hypothetical protein
MMPFHSWSVPGRKPGTSTKVSTGTLNGVARAHEAGGLLERRCPACRELRRLVRHDADGRPSTPPKPAQDVRREERLHLEELLAVDDVRDHRVHVVRLVRRVRHERVELAVVVGDVGAGSRRRRTPAGSSRLLLGRYDSRART